MRPSERIKELYIKACEDFPDYDDNPLKAIMDYLDEEWEKKQKPLPKIEAQASPVGAVTQQPHE